MARKLRFGRAKCKNRPVRSPDIEHPLLAILALLAAWLGMTWILHHDYSD